jgi:hypothetical protein
MPHSTRQYWTNGLARLSQLALSFRPFGSFLSFGCSDCLQSSNLLTASLDPFWLSAGFNTVVCFKWRHQQIRFEQVECRNGFMSLVKHSLLSIASTPSEVVKQVLASIESQEVFNSKESLGTLGICRVCIISSIGERQVPGKLLAPLMLLPQLAQHSMVGFGTTFGNTQAL